MHQTRGAVVPRIMGDTAGVVRCLDVLEQPGMVPGFDPEDIVEIVIVQGRNVRGIGTQGVFGDNELEMRVILAQLGDEAFGSMAFAIIFLRSFFLDCVVG